MELNQEQLQRVRRQNANLIVRRAAQVPHANWEQTGRDSQSPNSGASKRSSLPEPDERRRFPLPAHWAEGSEVDMPSSPFQLVGRAPRGDERNVLPPNFRLNLRQRTPSLSPDTSPPESPESSSPSKESDDDFFAPKEAAEEDEGVNLRSFAVPERPRREEDSSDTSSASSPSPTKAHNDEIESENESDWEDNQDTPKARAADLPTIDSPNDLVEDVLQAPPEYGEPAEDLQEKDDSERDNQWEDQEGEDDPEKGEDQQERSRPNQGGNKRSRFGHDPSSSSSSSSSSTSSSDKSNGSSSEDSTSGSPPSSGGRTRRRRGHPKRRRLTLRPRTPLLPPGIDMYNLYNSVQRLVVFMTEFQSDVERYKSIAENSDALQPHRLTVIKSAVKLRNLDRATEGIVLRQLNALQEAADLEIEVAKEKRRVAEEEVKRIKAKSKRDLAEASEQAAHADLKYHVLENEYKAAKEALEKVVKVEKLQEIVFNFDALKAENKTIKEDLEKLETRMVAAEKGINGLGKITSILLRGVVHLFSKISELPSTIATETKGQIAKFKTDYHDPLSTKLSKFQTAQASRWSVINSFVFKLASNISTVSSRLQAYSTGFQDRLHAHIPSLFAQPMFMLGLEVFVHSYTSSFSLTKRVWDIVQHPHTISSLVQKLDFNERFKTFLFDQRTMERLGEELLNLEEVQRGLYGTLVTPDYLGADLTKVWRQLDLIIEGIEDLPTSLFEHPTFIERTHAFVTTRRSIDTLFASPHTVTNLRRWLFSPVTIKLLFTDDFFGTYFGQLLRSGPATQIITLLLAVLIDTHPLIRLALDRFVSAKISLRSLLEREDGHPALFDALTDETMYDRLMEDQSFVDFFLDLERKAINGQVEEEMVSEFFLKALKLPKISGYFGSDEFIHVLNQATDFTAHIMFIALKVAAVAERTWRYGSLTSDDEDDGSGEPDGAGPSARAEGAGEATGSGHVSGDGRETGDYLSRPADVEEGPAKKLDKGKGKMVTLDVPTEPMGGFAPTTEGDFEMYDPDLYGPDVTPAYTPQFTSSSGEPVAGPSKYPGSLTVLDPSSSNQTTAEPSSRSNTGSSGATMTASQISNASWSVPSIIITPPEDSPAGSSSHTSALVSSSQLVTPTTTSASYDLLTVPGTIRPRVLPPSVSQAVPEEITSAPAATLAEATSASSSFDLPSQIAVDSLDAMFVPSESTTVTSSTSIEAASTSSPPPAPSHTSPAPTSSPASTSAPASTPAPASSSAPTTAETAVNLPEVNLPEAGEDASSSADVTNATGVYPSSDQIQKLQDEYGMVWKWGSLIHPEYYRSIPDAMEIWTRFDGLLGDDPTPQKIHGAHKVNLGDAGRRPKGDDPRFKERKVYIAARQRLGLFTAVDEEKGADVVKAWFNTCSSRHERVHRDGSLMIYNDDWRCDDCGVIATHPTYINLFNARERNGIDDKFWKRVLPSMDYCMGMRRPGGMDEDLEWSRITWDVLLTCKFTSSLYLYHSTVSTSKGAITPPSLFLANSAVKKRCDGLSGRQDMDVLPPTSQIVALRANEYHHL
nr:uncharacterized protein CI109_000436 [Kwoniella shandongensis]KAA5530866.1 hypothetical protein CI109_000436 [Kwoniella shandongensis]